MRCFAIVTICLLSAGAGCSGGKAGLVMASVSGKVTLGGQPVSGLMLNFESPKTGQAASATLSPAGEYEIADVAVDEYVVTLSSAAMNEEAVEPTAVKQPEKPAFPPKYQSPATSDLKATVGRGRNEVNFELTP